MTDRKVIKTKWKPRPARKIQTDGADFRQLLFQIQQEPNRDNKDAVKRVMEHFCWLYTHKRKIPDELKKFIAIAFHDFVNNKKDLNKAFKIKKEKSGAYSKFTSEACSEHVAWTMYTYINNQSSRYYAEELASRRYKISRQTIHKHCEQNLEGGIFNAILNIELNGKMNKDQIKKIKEIFPNFVYKRSLPLNIRDILHSQNNTIGNEFKFKFKSTLNNN